VRHQAQAYAVERGPQLGDRRGRLEEPRQLLLQIAVIAPQQRQEIGRHVAILIQS
jgi:hypothetical protein